MIKLRPKAFAVLEYLLARPGQLITKDELLNAVWPGTFVGEAVLKVAIRQIREALNDDPKSPRYIDTAHRRGYRFIARVTDSDSLTKNQKPRPVEDIFQGVVGRERALVRMRSWLEKVFAGERQVVFINGEAGIGKTALVDTFMRSIAMGRSIRISRGQCLEQYGTGEAYLPVLDAIGRLCREQAEVVDVLRIHAPMWLLQMPSVVKASDRELLSRRVVGATRERMMREMGDALEVLTADRPLVLILEDLHWSDYSTLDLISYLAKQRHAAQLMLIGTYRTVELILSGHPLKAVKQELLAKQQCEELPLEYLSEESVAKYLSFRFAANRFPAELAVLIHERTEGNPLFMVNTVDYLVAEGLIVECEDEWELVADVDKVEVGVPESIKQMIERQIDHLDVDQQRTLEAASVAGAEFSTLAVVAGLDEDRTVIEARCDELARQHHFIQAAGVQILPNEEVVSRYGFVHALYQNVLYERLSESRRMQLHRRIGERGEALYADRAREIAAELAMHFERGGDYKKAVKYLQQAAEDDIRRFAYLEAVSLARRGLGLIQKLPDTPERARQELSLHITLGVPLIATEGYASPDVGPTYTRARELCRLAGETEEIAQVLWGLWTFYIVKAEMGTALAIAKEFLSVAERLAYSELTMEVTLIHLGEFAPAMDHFEKAFALYDPETRRDDTLRYSQNAGVATQVYAAWALWFLGRPDQAVDQMEKTLALARDLAEPHGLAHALFYAATLHQLRREDRLALQLAEAGIAISTEHSLVLYQAVATVIRGWALLAQGRYDEAIEQIQQGLAAYQATGTALLGTHFSALLAEALHKAGKTGAALHVLEEALATVDRNGERYYQAELYRLKGELLLHQSANRTVAHAVAGGQTIVKTHPAATANAEACFHQSIKVSRQQGSNSFELRSVMSLARLYQNQGKQEEARNLLAEIYGKFTEGFETKDLHEAKALLATIEKP